MFFGHEFVFYILVFRKRQSVLKICSHELVELRIDSGDLVGYFLNLDIYYFLVFSLLFLGFGNEPISNGIRQRDFFQLISDLFRDDLLADIFLLAWTLPLGTAEIIMTFLRFGGDKATALAAVK